MPPMAPTCSINGGCDGARALIRKGVKGGTRDRILTRGASGVRTASCMTSSGTMSTIMIGPIRVCASRGVSQKAPMAVKITA